MAGPQMYEISSVSSTKGCSKQIHDLLTGGARLFLRWVRLNSMSLPILSGLHGYFGTFPRGIGYFHCFLALCSSACKKMVNLAGGLWLLKDPDRTSVVWGKGVNNGGRRTIKKKIWLLAAQFPHSLPATHNGSPT